MHGLVTLLPHRYYQQVENLWDALEIHFGLKGIRITPFPHFSWHIGSHYRLSQIEKHLKRIAAQTPLFSVQTNGLGCFTAQRPVIFIQVLRSPKLDSLHNQLWQAAAPIARGMSDYYHPAQWIPHISLAYDDLTAEMLPDVQTWLRQRDTFQWQMKVDNLSFIYEPDGKKGKLKFSIPLSGR